MPKTKNEYLMWNINTRTLYDGTGVNIDMYYSIIRGFPDPIHTSSLSLKEFYV